MHTKKLRLENLDCAACALALEKEIGKIDGIGSVSVDFMKQSMTLSYETEGALGNAIAAANRFENVKVAECFEASIITDVNPSSIAPLQAS